MECSFKVAEWLPGTNHLLSDNPLVFISAAEPSADLHGASLIRAAREIRPDIRFAGVAGPKMREAGCDVVYDMTRHSAMLLGALKSVGRAATMLRIADGHLRRYAFSACVVIDSPTLHLPLAGKAQAAGVPVLYYIAPQMWAWGTYRIHKLRNRTECVAVILPFEEEFFRNQGVNATYVGHPLADRLSAISVDQARVNSLRQGAAPVVALMPGSRRHVVREVLRGQLEIGQEILQSFPNGRLLISVANDQVKPVIADAVSRSAVRAAQIARGPEDPIAAADLVLVASGTSALEIAFHEKPMIVMYNASKMFYHLVARWMIHTPLLSLPNILAGREIVPEFMPYYTSTDPIAKKAIELLASEDARHEMSRNLAEVVAPMRGTHASQRTAELLVKLMDQSHH